MATVLVVDDNKDNRDLVVTVLKYAGHAALEAANGELGLDAVRAHHPELIICDILMPTMDGYEFVRQLRLDHAFDGIPVVFHTATFLEREARALANSCGVQEVLTKPAEPQAILATVTRVLEHAGPTPAAPVNDVFDRAHLRLITNRLVKEVAALDAEIARREVVQAELTLYHDVANVLSDTSDTQEAFDKALGAICQQLQFALGVLWATDGDLVDARLLSAWHAPGDAPRAEFLALSRSYGLRRGRGVMGGAWQSGEPAFSTDVQANPKFARTLGAAKASLRGAYFLPIRALGRVAAVLEFFREAPASPDDALAHTLAVLAHQVGRHVERYEQQRNIERLNRVYAVLSGVNALIIRVNERDELFREACRIAVEDGKFSRAWVGLVAFNPLAVRIAAAHGQSPEYFVKLDVLLADADPADHARFSHALQSGTPLVYNDIEHEATLPFREEIMADGTRSVAWLPLVIDGRTAALLVLHASEPGFFDEGEMRLLRDLASDIAFGLHQIEKSERLNYLALFDLRTDLANVRLFRERLAPAIENALRLKTKLAIVLLDIPHFKAINDAYGRKVGDELLQLVARRLEATAASPAHVASFGSDQFLLLLPGVADESHAARLADEEALSCFRDIFAIDDVELRCDVKAGVTLCPDDGVEVDILLRNAESALNKAKSTGDQLLFYAEEMSERVVERMQLDNRLRRALDGNEFLLYYQPKVYIEGGGPMAVEALIRWRHPDRGLVLPGEFIPLMEETGFIVNVGLWVLKQALADRGAWMAHGLPAPRIAINVSAVQLRKQSFVTDMADVLNTVKAPAGIDVEVTESMMMDDVEGNIAKLNALRDLGVEIAIDDFGTGYSSLAYLGRLPAQSVKIDRSFVSTMLDDPDKTTLVSTIISLAHSLRRQVVAEGVETPEQANMLRLLRCDQMQGYYVSEPLSFDRMTEFIRDRG